MAYLVNRTQSSFTMIQNSILRDTRLKLSDRGLLCTMMSLPDGWDFSISGMAKILPDGKDSIQSSLNRLKKLGYVQIYQTRAEDGRMGKNVVEVFSEPQIIENEDRPIRLSVMHETPMTEEEHLHEEALVKDQKEEPEVRIRFLSDCEEEEEKPEGKVRGNWSELSTIEEQPAFLLKSVKTPRTLENTGFQPCPGKPDAENPPAVKLSTGNQSTIIPSAESPGQYNTYLSNNHKSKMYGCIYTHTRTREEEGSIAEPEADHPSSLLHRVSDRIGFEGTHNNSCMRRAL